jgi:hypothetical protein
MGCRARWGSGWLVLGLVVTASVSLVSCASKPRVVAPSSTPTPARLQSIETVVVLEPEMRITDLRGKDTTAAYETAALTRHLLVTTAAQVLRERRPEIRTLAPRSPTWPEDHASLLQEWSGRSLQVTRGRPANADELAALLDRLGLGAGAAVLFTSMEARLGYDGYGEVPLVFTGQADAHMTVLRTALYPHGSSVASWTNSILLRAHPTTDSPHLREAVRQLFTPLQR